MVPLIAGLGIGALLIANSPTAVVAAEDVSLAFTASSFAIHGADRWAMFRQPTPNSALASYAPLATLAAVAADDLPLARALSGMYVCISLLIHAGTDWVD